MSSQNAKGNIRHKLNGSEPNLIEEAFLNKRDKNGKLKKSINRCSGDDREGIAPHAIHVANYHMNGKRPEDHPSKKIEVSRFIYNMLTWIFDGDGELAFWIHDYYQEQIFENANYIKPRDRQYIQQLEFIASNLDQISRDESRAFIQKLTIKDE